MEQYPFSHNSEPVVAELPSASKIVESLRELGIDITLEDFDDATSPEDILSVVLSAAASEGVDIDTGLDAAGIPVEYRGDIE